MVKDQDVYPEDTVVRIRKNGLFALIKQRNFLRPELKLHFLNYLGEVEGREGLYALYHEDIDLECLPPSILRNLELSLQ